MNGPPHKLSVIDDGHVDSLKSGAICSQGSYALGPRTAFEGVTAFEMRCVMRADHKSVALLHFNAHMSFWLSDLQIRRVSLTNLVKSKSEHEKWLAVTCHRTDT